MTIYADYGESMFLRNFVLLLVNKQCSKEWNEGDLVFSASYYHGVTVFSTDVFVSISCLTATDSHESCNKKPSLCNTSVKAILLQPAILQLTEFFVTKTKTCLTDFFEVYSELQKNP